MQSCDVYFRSGRIYIACSTELDCGLWLSCKPMLQLDEVILPEELGKAVLDVLSASHPNLRSLDETTMSREEFLSFVGFRSWGAFAKGSHYLMVMTDGKSIAITPTVKDSKGGFKHREKDTRQCPIEPRQIGRAIFEQRKLCG